MSKYKIIIGDGLFESECFRDDLGFVYKFPHNGGNVIREETLKLMGAKIEEIKEPLCVEFETHVEVPYSRCGISHHGGSVQSMSLEPLLHKRVRVTVEEILPTKCEHQWFYNDRCEYRCKKCGKMKL